MSDWNAAEYHRISDPQFSWGLSVVERVRALDLSSVQHACDAGCGTGRVTREFIKVLPASCNVVALDASAKMLDEAERELSEFGRRIEFVIADFQELPFISKFELLFSTAAFHWARNHERLFSSLFRALKPGGRVVAQCGGGPNLERVRARSQSVMREARFARYFASWTSPWNYADVQTTSTRLRDAGFHDIEVWLQSTPIHMSDERSYRAFLETVIERTQLEKLPTPELREAYLDEMIRMAANDMTFDYWRMNINAMR